MEEVRDWFRTGSQTARRKERKTWKRTQSLTLTRRKPGNLGVIVRTGPEFQETRIDWSREITWQSEKWDVGTNQEIRRKRDAFGWWVRKRAKRKSKITEITEIRQTGWTGDIDRCVEVKRRSQLQSTERKRKLDPAKRWESTERKAKEVGAKIRNEREDKVNSRTWEPNSKEWDWEEIQRKGTLIHAEGTSGQT